MNEIEKIVRDWIREIGRAKTRQKCNILDRYIRRAVFHYEPILFTSRVFASREECLALSTPATGNADPVITKDDLRSVSIMMTYESSGPYSQAFNKVTHNNTEGFEMKGYYMMITVNEDRMGNLHLAPVSEKHSQELTAMHNQTEVWAQEGMQFQREILERLPKNAIRNMRGGWTATTRVPIDLFYHWVEFCAWEV